MDKRYRDGGSWTETLPPSKNETPKNRLMFRDVGQFDLDNTKNLEKASYKDSGEHLEKNLEGITAKIAEFGFRGMNALAQFPFSPHPLGRQDSEIGNAQLTQSDHETRLMNHGLAFQFQDAFEKAASFHFTDSEAFQNAKDLALGSIAKIDNVQRKKKYLLEILGGKTILDVDEPLKECLETIKELKTDTPVKLSMSKLKIKAYADNINKQAEGIKNKLRSISETKQFIETLIKHVGASKPLETLKRNLETYENVLESATELEEKFSKSIKNVFNSNSPHKIVDLKALETDAKELIKARGALSAFNKDYTNEQKNAAKHAFNEYINYLQQETQDKFAESTKQIEKIEQEFKEAVQKEEEAATVAHLIIDRSQGRVSINNVWVDVREINNLDFSKEGQTTVGWRPDIPEILIKKAHDVESGQKLVEDKVLQEIYAKRLGKVEKSTGLGKCTFEISDSDFSKFSTPNRKLAGRRKAVLTMNYTKDHNDKPVDQICERIIEIGEIERQIAPSKIEEKKDENVSTITKTYKFQLDGKNITVTRKDENMLDTRFRGGGSEQIETQKVTQTQVVEDAKGKKRTTTRNYRLTQIKEKTGIISKEEMELYTEYGNAEGELVKSIHEMPTETLKSITIDLSTTNRRMLAESMVSIETKTLPDSPIIYHSEVRPNPEVDLRQTDRINLDAKKFYLRNGRTINLDPTKPKGPDWLKTKDERTYVPNCGLILQLTGPTRSHLVPLNYAGSDNLFTQQDKDKENALIETVKENQTNLLCDLKQSIDLVSNSIGSDTFDPEILQKAFRTAEMRDNEVNRQIALNKEMIMNPPENRNDLAQLMKSREAFQRDAAMPKTVDGNSEQTRKMTEDTKKFCRGLVDAITDKGKDRELLTQIVADQQGLDKLVAYDEYNHALSLVDNKTLGLIDDGKKIFDTDDGRKIFGLSEDDSKIFDLTNPTTVTEITEISKKVKNKIPELTTDMNGKIKKLTDDIKKEILEFQTMNNKKFIEALKEDKIKDFWENVQAIAEDVKKIKNGIDGAIQHVEREKNRSDKDIKQPAPNLAQSQHAPDSSQSQHPTNDENTEIIDSTNQNIEKLLKEYTTTHMKKIEGNAIEIATKIPAIDNITKLAGITDKEIIQLKEQFAKLKQLTDDMEKGGLQEREIHAADNPVVATNLTTREGITKANDKYLGITYRLKTMIKDLEARKGKINQFIECARTIERFVKESQEKLPRLTEQSQQLTEDADKLNVLVKYEKNPETATGKENLKELTAALTQQGANKLEELRKKNTEPSRLPEETKKLIHDEHIKLLDKITKVINSENIKESTETLNEIKKSREYIEKGNKFIDGVDEHADQIEDVMHLISNMKKIEADIDNSSDLYAKNWLNLKRAKAAADHNKFKDIKEAKVSTAISKEAARHNKNWLIIRNAIEDEGIKGVYSYIASLKAPTLSNINSLKGAREAPECSWVQYLESVTSQAHGDYASIKVALSKAEYIRQYIDKHEKIAQAVISPEVSPEEEQKQMKMLQAMQDIDETFLITPARPNLSRDLLASMQSQKDDNYTFNPDRLKNKSPEQLSKELRVLTGKDLEYAMRDVGKLIEQTDDPILKEIYRKNAPKMALAMAKSASELRKQLIEIQDWWQRLPELKKQQRRNFLMSLIEATILQVTNGQRYVNDGLGKINGSVVKGIVG